MIDDVRRLCTPLCKFDYYTKSDDEIMEGIKWRYDFRLTELDSTEKLLDETKSYKIFMQLISDRVSQVDMTVQMLGDRVEGCLDFEAARSRDKSIMHRSDDDIAFLMFEGFCGSLSALTDLFEL